MIQIKNSALLPYVAKNNLTKIPALDMKKCGDFFSYLRIKNSPIGTIFN